MTAEQQGDVLLFQTDNDGDIKACSGLIQMTGGLPTAAYLSLFGGNYDDTGRPGSSRSWWGNADETRESYKYRSETQHLLGTLPVTSNNLKRFEDAAKRDLAWFVGEGAASSVTVTATAPALNVVRLVIDINAESGQTQLVYEANWLAGGAEPDDCPPGPPPTIPAALMLETPTDWALLTEDGGAILLEGY